MENTEATIGQWTIKPRRARRGMHEPSIPSIAWFALFGNFLLLVINWFTHGHPTGRLTEAFAGLIVQIEWPDITCTLSKVVSDTAVGGVGHTLDVLAEDTLGGLQGRGLGLCVCVCVWVCVVCAVQ